MCVCVSVCLWVCLSVYLCTFVVQTKHQFVCLWSCNRVHCEVFCLLFPVLLWRSAFFPVLFPFSLQWSSSSCFLCLDFAFCCQDHSRCYHDNHKTRVYFMHVCDEKLQHVWVELWNMFSDVLLSSNTSAAERVSEHMGHCTTPQTAPQTMLTEEKNSSSCFHHWPDSDWYPLCDPLWLTHCVWRDLLQAQGQPQIRLKQRPREQLFACCGCFLSVWFVLVKIKKTLIIDY